MDVGLALAWLVGVALGLLLMALWMRGRYSTAQAVAHERLRALEAQLAQTSELSSSLQSQLSSAQRELAATTARADEQQRHAEEQLARQQVMSETARKTLTEEFQNLASAILEDKSRRFSEQNLQSLGHLLDPFKERLNEFKKRVEEIHYQDTQQQAMLKSELESLKSLNQQMSAEAHDLATALKGQAKKQGNWGELVLENVLARSGLQEGKDYRREVSFKAEEGKQRPDVIVYLPDAKHLIVDAKVSLNAYTRYVNADEELARKQALAEHIKAMSDRIKELSDRRYFDLGELNSQIGRAHV